MRSTDEACEQEGLGEWASGGPGKAAAGARPSVGLAGEEKGANLGVRCLACLACEARGPFCGVLGQGQEAQPD